MGSYAVIPSLARICRRSGTRDPHPRKRHEPRASDTFGSSRKKTNLSNVPSSPFLEFAYADG